MKYELVLVNTGNETPDALLGKFLMGNSNDGITINTVNPLIVRFSDFSVTPTNKVYRMDIISVETSIQLSINMYDTTLRKLLLFGAIEVVIGDTLSKETDILKISIWKGGKELLEYMISNILTDVMLWKHRGGVVNDSDF